MKDSMTHVDVVIVLILLRMELIWMLYLGKVAYFDEHLHNLHLMAFSGHGILIQHQLLGRGHD